MTRAREFAEQAKKEFTKKANHNKTESLSCFLTILICSLSAPLFITLGEEKIFAKIIPSILSVLSAGFTSWLQLRKPQKLWSIYRGAQRSIENELAKCEFLIGDYKKSDDADSLLVEKVSSIILSTHNDWALAVPNPENSNDKNEIK